MIVAKTKCCMCNSTIELDDKDSWTENDEGKKWVICDECCENGGRTIDDY